MALNKQLTGQRHLSFFTRKSKRIAYFFQAACSRLLVSSSSIQKAMLTTFLLNGVVFLGGQVFLETFYPVASLLGLSYVVTYHLFL